MASAHRRWQKYQIAQCHGEIFTSICNRTRSADADEDSRCVSYANGEGRGA